MTEEFIEKLKEYGFKLNNSGFGVSQAFRKETYMLEPKILVQGSHATDIATIHYSDEEEINGFCYYSSLFEEMPMMFSENHNVESIIKKINKYLDAEIKIKCHNGYVFLVVECDETD